jgi:histidinol-phosphatase (PHP family)
MLTDYHVHLRPDDLSARAADHFTEANAERYLEAAREAGVEELGVSEHIYRFEAALAIWRHPFWEENAIDDLDVYCEFVRTTPLRLGIEADFIAGAEDRIASLLDSRDFDFVIGSVHFLGDRAVDHDGYDVWEGSGEPDEVWSRYFATVAEAARSGLFDILAHPDLVKVWGAGRPQPRRDPRFHYEPLVEAVAETGVAVEISTAGLRKPAAELYPSATLAEMLVDAGAAFALSSDAHEPRHVGWEYPATVETIRGWGINEIAVFEGRRRRMEALG